MDNEIKQFISLCRKPQMYTRAGGFDAVCAYIDGYNSAFQGKGIVGFRKWLLADGDSWTNLPWWALILRYDVTVTDPFAVLTEDQDSRARAALAVQLELYLECLQAGGLEAIYQKYIKWVFSVTDDSVEGLRERLA